MKRAIIQFVVLLIVGMIPTVSDAITSPCLKKLHYEAILDAVNLTPPDLKEIMKKNEKSLREHINTIHGISARERTSYESAYKEIVNIMKTADSNQLNYLVRIMTHISIYPFLKYSPMRTYESCNEDSILSEITVYYDGYRVCCTNIFQIGKSLEFAGILLPDKISEITLPPLLAHS